MEIRDSVGKRGIDSKDLICLKCGHTCNRHYQAGNSSQAYYRCIDCDCVTGPRGAFKERKEHL